MGGLDDWAPLGLFGGDVQGLAASPQDPDLLLAGVLASSDPSQGGLYRSTDGGATWLEVAAFQSRALYEVAFAPDGTAYAAPSTGLWKSTDGGLTWVETSPPFAARFHDLEFVAGDPSRIWAAVDSPPAGGLLRSAAAGATWTVASPNSPQATIGWAVAIHPADPQRLYAAFTSIFGTSGRVWASADGGASWTDRTAGLRNVGMFAIEHDGTRLLAGGGQIFNQRYLGLYASPDEGVTWSPLHDASWPLLTVRDLALDPAHPGVLLAATEGTGIHRSEDGGASWQIAAGGSAGMTVDSLRFAAAAGHPARVLAGAHSFGPLVSEDAGVSFAARTAGLNELFVNDLASRQGPPHELAVAFQGLNSGGVFTSSDGGASWQLEPLPAIRFHRVAFAADGTLFAAAGGPIVFGAEGIYRREANGAWTALGPDLGPAFESDLRALALGHATAGQVLAGGVSLGAGAIWRSEDSGASWEWVYVGTGSEAVTDLLVVPDGDDQRLLAAFTGAAQGGVLYSLDRGDLWQLAPGLPGAAQGAGFCPVDGDPDSVLLADSGAPGGLHRSADGGQGWSPLALGGEAQLKVACDRRTPDLVYALGGPPNHVVRRSRDGGLNFHPIDQGLPSRPWRVLHVDRGGAARLLLAGVGAFRLALPIIVFGDGFESGDLSAWSNAVP